MMDKIQNAVITLVGWAGDACRAVVGFAKEYWADLLFAAFAITLSLIFAPTIASGVAVAAFAIGLYALNVWLFNRSEAWASFGDALMLAFIVDMVTE